MNMMKPPTTEPEAVTAAKDAVTALEATATRLQAAFDLLVTEAAGIPSLIQEAALSGDGSEVLRLKARQAELRLLIPLAELPIRRNTIELSDARNTHRAATRKWLGGEMARLGKAAGYPEGIPAYEAVRIRFYGTDSGPESSKKQAESRIQGLLHELVIA